MIVMLHQGAVVEVGTHDDLMLHQGRYHALYRQQEALDEDRSAKTEGDCLAGPKWFGCNVTYFLRRLDP